MDAPANIICQQVVPQRFWSKVTRVGSCWRWTGGTSDGYGLFWWSGRTVSAHRFLYERLVGAVPDGLDLDHRCRHRDCVRPEHLRAVTHRENLLAGVGFVAENAKKTLCKRGHPLITTPRYDGTGRTQRRCRVCKSASKSQHYRRRKKAEQSQPGVPRSAAAAPPPTAPPSSAGPTPAAP